MKYFIVYPAHCLGIIISLIIIKELNPSFPGSHDNYLSRLSDIVLRCFFISIFLSILVFPIQLYIAKKSFNILKKVYILSVSVFFIQFIAAPVFIVLYGFTSQGFTSFSGSHYFFMIIFAACFAGLLYFIYEHLFSYS